jgi:hypothetical protein
VADVPSGLSLTPPRETKKKSGDNFQLAQALRPLQGSLWVPPPPLMLLVPFKES